MGEEPHEAPRRRRPSLGVIAAVVGVAAVIALLAIGLARDDLDTTIQDALAEGQRPDAPALSLPVLHAGDGLGPEGARIDVDDLRGRIVVVNFWASWCEPCRDESPLLERVAARYRDDGAVVMLGVNVQDLRGDARDFIGDYALTYPSVRDGGDDVRRDWEVVRLPETFIVDARGRIALKIPGPVTSEEQLTTPIGQLLAAPS